MLNQLNRLFSYNTSYISINAVGFNITRNNKTIKEYHQILIPDIEGNYEYKVFDALFNMKKKGILK